MKCVYRMGAGRFVIWLARDLVKLDLGFGQSQDFFAFFSGGTLWLVRRLDTLYGRR